MVKTVVPAELSGIGEGLDFIEKALKEYKFKPKYIREAMLLSEESMVRLVDNASEDATIHIHVKKKMGLASITLSAPGTELTGSVTSGFDISSGDLDRSNESQIRGILLKAYEDKIRYARKGKYNFIDVTAGMPEQVFALRTVAALFLAILVGFVLQAFLPDAVKTVLDKYVFNVIEQIFINMLMLIAAPSVFFSVMNNIANYASFSDPGRVSVKMFVGCALASIVAVIVGIASYQICMPGTLGQLAPFVSIESLDVSNENLDLISTLVNIVPPNIIDPFRNVDTVQLIFLALICGIALGRIGDYSSTLRNMTEAFNTLFSKIVSILMNIIPLVVFVSTISMMLNIGNGILLSVLQLFGTVLLGALIMMIIYCIIVLVIARVSPVTFLKKYYPTMKETFILGSGIAALPKTMRCCKNVLGISPKVYSFAIPFGANFNMEGNCIYLSIAGLFIAKLCGLQSLANEIIPLAFMVLILSIGAPIVPGSAIVCLSVILNQMGISMVAVSVLFGINAVIEMFVGMLNTLGDVALSLAIARSEDFLNTEVFNAKPKVYK